MPANDIVLERLLDDGSINVSCLMNASIRIGRALTFLPVAR